MLDAPDHKVELHHERGAHTQRPSFEHPFVRSGWAAGRYAGGRRSTVICPGEDQHVAAVAGGANGAQMESETDKDLACSYSLLYLN